MSWIVFVYRLPAQPSRHRVGVWREFRRIGALPIQQSIYILPDGRENLESLARVASIVEGVGGESHLLQAEAVDEPTRTRLEAAQFERLERWAADLAANDRFGAPSRSVAEQALKECGAALEDFATRVLAAEDRS